MQKHIQTAFIAAFMLMITLPFILFGVFNGIADTNNYENRVLTTLRDIADAPLTKKPMKIESFLNDNAPFKNEFLQLNAAINYGIFNCIQNGEVLLGNNEYLFYKNVSDSKSIDDYQGLNAYSLEKTQDLSINLNILDNLLAAQDKELILLIAPNKERVYSQYMPNDIPKIAPSKADLLYEHLLYSSTARVLYPRKQLIELSHTQQAYYKYDTHWNNAGALVALKQLSPSFEGCKALQAEGEALQDLSYLSALYNILPKDDFFEIKGTVNQTGQRLLMLHDSFGNALIPQLEKAYDCTFVHSAEFDKFDITQETDIVVIETVERFIDNLLPRIQSMIEALQ